MRMTYFSDSCLACALFVLAAIVAAGSHTASAQSSSAKGWSNLKYAIYFTSHDVDALLADSDQFKKTMEYFAPVKPVHVYLEGKTSGDVNVALLKQLSEQFRALDIRVSGAMVPMGRRGPSAYNDPEDMAALEKRIRPLAQVFDEIIIDDWLFTTVTDPKSVAERGNQSWADYRTKLILEQAQKHLIGPAKQENPNVKIIIKYPNWYECHRDNGYDVYGETLLFDKMAVGIETRNRMVHDQHIPIYSGYIFQKWWPSVDPKKWVASWLDNYDMKGDYNDYNAQVWQAVLAQTPEIILWCAGQLYPTNPNSDVYPYFTKLLPEFDRVAGMLKGEARGVPIYLPYGSTGEYNIFGYLGMAGIPLAPVAKFPTEEQNAIFTIHSLQDPNLAKQMLARLNDGKDVFLTWSLWKKLQHTEFKNTLGLLEHSGSVSSDLFRLRLGWFNTKVVKADRPFTFPTIETTTWPYARDVALVRDDADIGVLLNVQYLKGTIYVLNMPENSYDLLRLPAEAMNIIRAAFSKQLAVTLLGPGGVSMYPFGDKQYVLYNMSDQEANLLLRFDKKAPESRWMDLVRNAELAVKTDTTRVRFGGSVITDISLTLKPFEIAVVTSR